MQERKLIHQSFQGWINRKIMPKIVSLSHLWHLHLYNYQKWIWSRRISSFYLIFTFDSQLHWKMIRVNLINSVQNEASINPKATLLLNDIFFSFASSFSWQFLCIKVFSSAVLAWDVLSVFALRDSPVQLFCRLVPNQPPSLPQPSSLHIRKMSLLVKQSMNFHMTSGLCVSTIMQKTISTIALSLLY